MARTTICNMCGSGFETTDMTGGLSLYTRLGYGTKYDGDDLELDLCCKCTETLIENCRVSPIKESEQYVPEKYRWQIVT